MDQILQPIIDFYKKTGKVPGKRDIPSGKILWKYKTWSKAIEAAGLKPKRVVNPSEDQVINSLKRFSAEYDRSPRAEDCNKIEYMYDTKTYISALNVKTWAEVLERAGLEKYFSISDDINLSDEELLSKVRTLLESKGETSVNAYEKNKGTLPSSTYLCQRFRSWQTMLKLCNLELNVDKYDNNELLSMIINVSKELDRTPSTTELEKFTGIALRNWTKRFGSYNNILNSLKIEPAHKTPANVQESDDELMNMYIEFSNKFNFKSGAPSRILDESPEIYSSDVFAIRFGSMNALREKCGFPEVRRGVAKYTEKQILNELKELYYSLNRMPTVRDLKESNLPAISTILRYCKTTSIKEAFTKALNIK
jgi:hypothetical protein